MRPSVRQLLLVCLVSLACAVVTTGPPAAAAPPCRLAERPRPTPRPSHQGFSSSGGAPHRPSRRRSLRCASRVSSAGSPWRPPTTQVASAPTSCRGSAPWSWWGLPGTSSPDRSRPPSRTTSATAAAWWRCTPPSRPSPTGPSSPRCSAPGPPGAPTPRRRRCKVADRVHPASERLPEYWQRTDHWYNFDDQRPRRLATCWPRSTRRRTPAARWAPTTRSRGARTTRAGGRSTPRCGDTVGQLRRRRPARATSAARSCGRPA